MTKFLISLASALMICGAANATAEASATTLETISTALPARLTPYRTNYSFYNTDSQEWIHLYSSGDVSLVSDRLGRRITGKYSRVDNNSGIVFYFEGADEGVYCSVSNSSTGTPVSITYRGYVYRIRR